MSNDAGHNETEEEQLSIILDSISDGFISCDVAWRLIYCNATAERIIGIHRDQVIGRNLWEVFPLTLGTRLEKEFRLAATGEIRSFEYFDGPSGRWFLNRCFPQGVLTILKGLKRRAILDEEDKELLDLAIDENERMKILIRSLRDFNQPSPGRKTVMDVHASLDSLLMLYRNDFRRKGISTVLNYAEGLPRILAIPDQIKQVFLNLLNNATDACLPNGGQITITTCHVQQRVAVAITDTGIGISLENLDRIFHPFFTTKSTVKGTGLGLSVCHGIVQNHNGEIRVESRPGDGSTFTVLLPVNGK
jgi:PAS domain S-box-containing protein